MGSLSPNGRDVSVARRLAALHLLHSSFVRSEKDNDEQWLLVREIESVCHAYAHSCERYTDLVLKCARNCHHNPHNAHPAMALAPNDVLMNGSILQQIRDHEAERRRMFHRMLQEKSDGMGCQEEHHASLRCHRCKSVDVSWDIKQTRSADEASTAFCTCASCGHRWTIK